MNLSWLQYIPAIVRSVVEAFGKKKKPSVDPVDAEKARQGAAAGAAANRASKGPFR